MQRQWLHSVVWVPSVISPLLTHICDFLDVSGLIIEKSQGKNNDTGMGVSVMIGESVQYAAIIVSTLPILVVYPFLQKHFTKGVMIGSIKG